MSPKVDGVGWIVGACIMDYASKKEAVEWGGGYEETENEEKGNTGIVKQWIVFKPA